MVDISAYIQEKQRKGVKTRTYEIVLRRIIAECETRGIETDPDRIDDDLARIIGTVGATMYPKSAKRVWWLLGDWVKFETGTNVFARNRPLMNDIEKRRVFLGDGEIERLMDAATPPMKVALGLGVFLGFRVSEIRRAEWSDIDGGRITVTGKGHGEGKTATVPIPSILKRLLDGFKEWRSKFADHSDGRIVVWLNHSALLPYANNNSLSNAMKRIAEKVGIEFTTHSLRRLYATTLYDNGVDLLTVSRMLRHNSTRTTEQYREQTRENEKSKRDAHEGVRW